MLACVRGGKKHPQHKIYPYLLRELVIDRPNQVWCVDITYIPMHRGFLYLLVVMDWYSHKVLSWRLSNSMGAGCCVEALSEVIAKSDKPEIINRDQGSQFTGFDWRQAFKDADIKISMDGRGLWPPRSWFACKPLPGNGQPDDRAALAIANQSGHVAV